MKKGKEGKEIMDARSPEYRDIVSKLTTGKINLPKITKMSLTGLKDTDREVLLKMSDNDLLQACRINKYYREKVCDEQFFNRRLQSTYPNVLEYKERDKSWRQYFLETIWYISKMLEKYKYKYDSGNPKIQYHIFRSCGNVNNLLMYSSELGELNVVKEALKKGANIQRGNNYPLRIASKKGHIEIVKYLIENGVDIHSDTEIALRYASEQGHLEVVRYLVEHGADIHVYSDDSIRAASQKGHLEVVRYLVEHGANIHTYDDLALIWASEKGHLEVVKYLVDNGANIHARHDLALRLATEHGYLEVARYLVEQSKNK